MLIQAVCGVLQVPQLVTHLDMYEYLAEDRHRNHAKGAEQYEQEWQNTKGGEV